MTQSKLALKVITIKKKFLMLVRVPARAQSRQVIPWQERVIPSSGIIGRDFIKNFYLLAKD